MGNENLVYYGSLIILGAMLLGYGAWVYNKMTSTCTSKGLEIGLRGMLCTGTVLLTAAIGITMCSIFCVHHAEELSGKMTFFLGLGSLFGSIFCAMVLSQYKKCIPSDNQQSVGMWIAITMTLLIIFTGFSWGYSIYRSNKKNAPKEQHKQILAEKLRKQKLAERAAELVEERERQRELENARVEAEELQKKIEEEQKRHEEGAYERYLEQRQKAKEQAELTVEEKKKNKQLQKLNKLTKDLSIIQEYNPREPSNLKKVKNIAGQYLPDEKVDNIGKNMKKELVKKINDQILSIEERMDYGHLGLEGLGQMMNRDASYRQQYPFIMEPRSQRRRFRI